VVYVFEFFDATADGNRILIEVQKHRAKTADAADQRARTIIKNVALDGKAANLCMIKDQMGGLVREVTIGAHRALRANTHLA
jgi:hypothetical protein